MRLNKPPRIDFPGNSGILTGKKRFVPQQEVVMSGCGCGGSHGLLGQMEDPALRRFSNLLAGAAREYVAALQALGTARRTELAFGEGAGLRERRQAEAHEEFSISLFRQARQELDGAVAAFFTEHRAEVESFLGDRGLERYASSQRTRALVSLVHSDCPPALISRAVESLDNHLERLQHIRSADDVIEYMTGRVDQFMTTDTALRAYSDNGYTWCAFIVILSSLYGWVIVLCATACRIAGCDARLCIDNWMTQVCGAPLTAD
jgi:hypothetical protein